MTIATQNYPKIRNQYLINAKKFSALSFFSFGIYPVWWMFKEWRFFMQKDERNIRPALRASIAILFLYPLFRDIEIYARSKQYHHKLRNKFLFFGFILFSLIGSFPSPYLFLSVFSFLFLIPSFKALNYGKRESDDFVIIEQTKFSRGHIVVIILGSIFWLLILIGIIFQTIEPQG